MILQCPNCDTRYEIPVELPPEGRKVRCASCQHVWNATMADEAKPEIILPDFDEEEIVFKDDDTDEVPAQDSAEEPPKEEDPAPETADPFESVSAEPPPPEAPPGEDEPAEPVQDDLTESDLEEAFATAVAEADVETPEGMDDAEPEEPPIVIGKAKKKRGPLPTRLAAGWAALGLFVAGVSALAYFQRVNIVRAFPGAASTYESAGIPVNVRGLKFDKVEYAWESSAGRPVLEVYGEIVNITSEPLKVPTVVFGLRTKEKVEVYQWAADVRSDMLPAGKRAKFSAQIPTPPKSIRDVQVRFAKVR